MTYNIIIMPEGASLPEDLQSMQVEPGDFLSRIYACKDVKKFVPVNTRELQMIVEYRDLLPLELQAVIGLPGAMYNTVWNTYVSTMERVTIDNVRASLHEHNDDLAKQGQNTVVLPTRSDRMARFSSAVKDRNAATSDPDAADAPGTEIDGGA